MDLIDICFSGKWKKQNNKSSYNDLWHYGHQWTLHWLLFSLSLFCWLIIHHVTVRARAFILKLINILYTYSLLLFPLPPIWISLSTTFENNCYFRFIYFRISSADDEPFSLSSSIEERETKVRWGSERCGWRESQLSSSACCYKWTSTQIKRQAEG